MEEEYKGTQTATHPRVPAEAVGDGVRRSTRRSMRRRYKEGRVHALRRSIWRWRDQSSPFPSLTLRWDLTQASRGWGAKVLIPKIFSLTT